MKFHTQKRKLLPIAPLGKGLDNYWDQIFPLNVFYYHLNGVELEFVHSEKDLGIIVTKVEFHYRIII